MRESGVQRGPRLFAAMGDRDRGPANNTIKSHATPGKIRQNSFSRKNNRQRLIHVVCPSFTGKFCGSKHRGRSASHVGSLTAIRPELGGKRPLSCLFGVSRLCDCPSPSSRLNEIGNALVFFESRAVPHLHGSKGVIAGERKYQIPQGPTTARGWLVHDVARIRGLAT